MITDNRDFTSRGKVRILYCICSSGKAKHLAEACRTTYRRSHNEVEIKQFFDWLKFPRTYYYSTPNGDLCTGRTTVLGPRLCWFSVGGPVILKLVDLDAIRKYELARGSTIVGDELDWKPPKGLRKMRLVDWRYLEAKIPVYYDDIDMPTLKL